MKEALLYILICLIWGSTWISIKVGLNGIPPFLGAGLRFLFSAGIFTIWICLKKKRFRLDRSDKISAFSAGLLGFTFSYAFIYWAEQYIDSGLTAILFSTMPLFVALLSHFWTKSEPLTVRKLGGILTAMAGMAVLFLPLGRWPVHALGAMFAVLGSSVVSAVNLVILKKHSRNTDIYLLNALGMSMGAVNLLLLSFLTESWHQAFWSPANLLALSYLALFGSVAAFLAYYTLIKTLPATVLSTISLVFPVVAVFLGRFFLNERVTATTWVGIGAILCGVALAAFQPSGNRPPQFVPPEL